MHERTFLVKKLRDHLLGPCQGQLEELPDGSDPRDEYVTGVLAPWTPPDQDAGLEERDIEAEADVIGSDDSEEGDEQVEVAFNSGFSPALDPRRLPPSIGLSFLVRGGEPSLEVCVTGARYRKNSNGRWQRHPFGWLSGLQKLGPSELRLGDQVAEIEVRMRVSARPGGVHRVTLFLTNMAPPPEAGKSAPTTTLLFQPQIRVCLARGVELVSLLDTEGGPEQGPEASLRLLYRESAVKARGHLCGAVWREIDPESGDSEDAWSWCDREACPHLHRHLFGSPDLRTEFLPVLPVASPSLEWREQYGSEPLRDAMELAECSEADQLQKALEPLVVAYEAWLVEREAEARGLDPRWHQAANAHLALCRDSLRRLRSGIDCLLHHDEVRLAFCFANRAIAEQALWRGQKLAWRAFQLGFMLTCLEGIVNPESVDREVCDLLWFPTGGGKTEAYLGLTAFVLALRRLRSREADGTAVLSRYTLRLLSIQQFRRALRLITACELLRAQNWHPGQVSMQEWLWGTQRFSIGLWVGGGVTPNQLKDTSFRPPIPGAFSLLRRAHSSGGEPAQVLECPACSEVLAVPSAGRDRQEQAAYPRGSTIKLHLVVAAERPYTVEPRKVSTELIEVLSLNLLEMEAPDTWTLAVELKALEGVSSDDLDRWYEDQLGPALGRFVALRCARASRPGYFIRQLATNRGQSSDWTIELYCPAPQCPLANVAWRERVPVAVDARDASGADEWQPVLEDFASKLDPRQGTRVPIPALMVDEQLYAHPPSLVIATVDKLARLPYEPRAASLFGNVEHYHGRQGYYRQYCCREEGKAQAGHPPHPGQSRSVPLLRPPDLILQDELHLIDGPLGSMMGLYESAVEALCSRIAPPKYIASTATVREAQDQVQALFNRRLAQFPAPALSAGDSFFALVKRGEFGQEEGSGRLYLGFLAPAKGALTPLVRLWAILLQSSDWLERMGADGLDPYWTVVGYFNAVRELAGVTGLLRQDVPQWMAHLQSGSGRELYEPVELSSRMDSQRLPASLARLEQVYPNAERTVLATSMFGTGVDVARLSLMIVHGQPKTTSSYIQATGRVGRSDPGLIVTAFRASRPRDLDHYEFFTGYHLQLYRGVEPVTVFPFSPRARERALGPLCVALLRQARDLSGNPVHPDWRREVEGCRRMLTNRTSPEAQSLGPLFVARADGQPRQRKPPAGAVPHEIASALDVWKQILQSQTAQVRYVEYGSESLPQHPVILGDAQHVQARLAVAYPNAPTSLRDVEATTSFKT